MRFHLPVDGQWPTVAAFLIDHTRGAPGVQRRLDSGEVLLGDGTIVNHRTPYRGGDWVYLHRDLPDEAPVPGDIVILYADENIVVVDKPHFLATMPRGTHVVETALVRLRARLRLPELSPAHRLDRLTAGVLLLTTHREVRGAYQEMFARRRVAKEYVALAPRTDRVEFPITVRSRIVKRRGSLQTIEEPGEVNAVTRVEFDGQTQRYRGVDVGIYRLLPETGRTHQLRVHLARLGIPIIGDPLYPIVRAVAPGDFSRPLQLLARTLAFRDPVTRRERVFTSGRSLGCDDDGADDDGADDGGAAAVR